MEEKLVQQLLDQLLPPLEELEAKSAAIVRFLTDKKIGGENELAPYLEQETNASSIRWRAKRARINRLLSSVESSPEDLGEKKSPPLARPSTEASASQEAGKEPSGDEKATKSVEPAPVKPTPEQDAPAPADPHPVAV